MGKIGGEEPVSISLTLIENMCDQNAVALANRGTTTTRVRARGGGGYTEYNNLCKPCVLHGQVKSTSVRWENEEDICTDSPTVGHGLHCCGASKHGRADSWFHIYGVCHTMQRSTMILRTKYESFVHTYHERDGILRYGTRHLFRAMPNTRALLLGDRAILPQPF